MYTLALLSFFGLPFAFAVPTPVGGTPSTVTSNVQPRANGSGSSSFAASTTWSFTGNTLPSGLVIDTDYIATNFLDHKFDAKNVAVKDGFLQLTVPGGQSGHVISAAEVATTFKVLYGSVTTYAILTDAAGVCNGTELSNQDIY